MIPWFFIASEGVEAQLERDWEMLRYDKETVAVLGIDHVNVGAQVRVPQRFERRESTNNLYMNILVRFNSEHKGCKSVAG